MADDGPGGHPPPPKKCAIDGCDHYVPCPVHGSAGEPEEPTLPPADG